MINIVLIRPLPIITLFLDTLNQSLQTIKPSARLTKIQKAKLAMILMGIFVTETLNWAAFERRSLKQETSSCLSWIFRQAKISWQYLLQASIKNLLIHYEITTGVLVVDDTDKKRTKRTSVIPGIHKIKDKATGGYFNGQQLIFTALVTDIVTIPVGFQFYTPDPALTAWYKERKEQKLAKIPAKQRSPRPQTDHTRYPTKQMLALKMLSEFTQAFPEVKIKSVLADALYGTAEFMDNASALTSGAQVVSQLRCNQRVASKNSTASLKAYFARQAGVKTQLSIRGGEAQTVTLLAARLRVKAHGKRRFVVALKYEGEEDYRYLAASDLSWRYQDIAKIYTLRWLIEVFIQDWKSHGGWNKLAKQQGNKGSERGVILGLLCDHILLLHPEQSARLKNKQPGLSVGCLIEHIKSDALIDTIHEVVISDSPQAAFETLKQALQDCLPVRESKKHMVGRDLGRLEPTPSLKYRALEAA